MNLNKHRGKKLVEQNSHLRGAVQHVGVVNIVIR